MASVNVRSLRRTVLVLVLAFISRGVSGKRTCFVSLRLKTTSGYIEKDIPDFKVSSFLGSCSRIKKDCPGRVLDHVKGLYGQQVNPMLGNTTVNMCELFGRELLPEHEGDVDIVYKASSCSNNGYMHVKGLYGQQVNPMLGNTTVNMCELFGRELLPEHEGDVDIVYKASSCSNNGYMGIGRLCCFKCKVGPYTFYHPINHCPKTARPAWCLS